MERALHFRVVPVGVVPDVLVACVVVPVERGRHHQRRRRDALGHRLAADLLAFRLDEGHLLGERVVLVEEALFGFASVTREVEEAFEAGARLKQPALHQLRAIPAAHAGTLAPEVAGKRQEQREGTLHEVAVVELADAPALEDVHRS